MKDKSYSIKDYILNGVYLNLYFLVKYLPSPIGDFLRYVISVCFFKKLKSYRLGQGVTIWYPYNISIGSHVSINENCYLSGYGGITISKNVRIGTGTTIITSDHIVSDINVNIKDQGLSKAPVIINEDAWIGANVTILKGVVIGRGAILAACAMVNKDVPDFAIVGGVPARILKYRE